MRQFQSNPEGKWQRGFWGLFVTQFQETFSDNAYKFLLISIILAMPLTTSQRDSFVFCDLLPKELAKEA